MRSLKTSGGLTRGRGMTEQQRLAWLLGMPACAEENRSLQDLTGTRYAVKQNKDTSNARQQRDMKDVHTLLFALEDRSPFIPQADLRNIMNGVHAQGSVNVDRARAIGSGILDSMTGELAADFKFKIANQAITLGVKSSVHISGEQVQVNPQLLFQRLVTACKSQEEMESNLQFELCSYPPAISTC